MIVGVGVEWLDVPRFAAASRRFGQRLGERIFTDGERAYAGHGARAVQSLAVRFAAKVATRRALGLRAVAWREVEVVREGDGAPTLKLHGRARRAADALGVETCHLTLTHDSASCLSHVVMEDRP